MRGQIWYISKGKNYMEKKGGGRPAIIVSTDESNHGDRVMVVYLTTHESEREDKVPIMVKSTQSYAICDNINTVFKDQLSDYVGTIDQEDMKQIEEQMAKCLGLTARKDEPNLDAQFYKRAYEDLLAMMMKR